MTMYTKRSSARKSLDTDIRVSIVNRKARESAQKIFYNMSARLRNQSNKGMYIEIDQKLQPESMISIKMISPDSKPFDAYKLHLGRVRWCRFLEEKAVVKYGVGIQIYETVIQAPLHLSHPDLS